jgi:hypothetical protein
LIFNDWFDINDCIINHSISTFFFSYQEAQYLRAAD